MTDWLIRRKGGTYNFSRFKGGPALTRPEEPFYDTGNFLYYSV